MLKIYFNIAILIFIILFINAKANINCYANYDVDYNYSNSGIKEKIYFKDNKEIKETYNLLDYKNSLISDNHEISKIDLSKKIRIAAGENPILVDKITHTGRNLECFFFFMYMFCKKYN